MADFRKGDRIYSPLVGIATVVTGRRQSYTWGRDLIQPGLAMLVTTGEGTERLVWIQGSIKLTAATEALLIALADIRYEFVTLAVNMLSQGVAFEGIAAMFDKVSSAVNAARQPQKLAA